MININDQINSYRYVYGIVNTSARTGAEAAAAAGLSRRDGLASKRDVTV